MLRRTRRFYWSLKVFMISAMLHLGWTQENITELKPYERWHITSRNLQDLLHENTKGVADTEGYIRRFSESWRIYAKANDINKREKLRKALEGALASIEGRKRKSSTKLTHDSVSKIRGAAQMLKEFKTMYKLSHSVLDTWNKYQSARKNLINISKTDEGQDLLKRYITLRNDFMKTYQNKTKKSEIPRLKNLTKTRLNPTEDQNRSVNENEAFGDGTQYEIKLFRGIPGLRTIKKTRKSKIKTISKYRHRKRDEIPRAFHIVDDSIPQDEIQEEENTSLPNDQNELRKKTEIVAKQLPETAREAFEKARGIIEAALNSKENYETNQSDKKSSVSHGEGRTGVPLSNFSSTSSLGKVIGEAGSSKIRHTPKNASYHVMSVLASLVEGDEKQTSSSTKDKINKGQSLLSDQSSLRTSHPIIAGATFIKNKAKADESFSPKHIVVSSKEAMQNNENAKRKPNNTLDILGQAFDRNLKSSQSGNSGMNAEKIVKNNFHLTDEQKKEAQKVPILKLSDMKLLEAGGTHLNAAQLEKQANSSVLAPGITRQIETFKRLQEAKQARRRFVMAKQEFDNKMRELYNMANLLHDNHESDNTKQTLTRTISDEIPRDQVSTGDTHPGIALSGLLHTQSSSFSSDHGDNDDDHRGFTLGMLDKIVGSNQQHEIKLQEEGAKDVGKVYEVDLPKEFSLDEGQQAAAKTSDGQGNDDATIKALTDAIKEDLKELQTSEINEKKKEDLSGSMGIGSVIKQFEKEDTSKQTTGHVAEKQEFLSIPTEKQEAPPMQSTTDNDPKTDDAFKEVEDYLSRALDDIAKQADDESKPKHSANANKETKDVKVDNTKASEKPLATDDVKPHVQTPGQQAETLKEKPASVAALSLTQTPKPTKEVQSSEAKKPIIPVNSDKQQNMAKETPVVEKPKTEQELKPKPEQEQKTKPEQQEKPKPEQDKKPIVALNESAKVQTQEKKVDDGKDKPAEAPKATGGKENADKLEEEAKEKLLEKVMAKMEEQAKDPTNVHPLKLQAEVAPTPKPVGEPSPAGGKVDDHIAKPPSETKASPAVDPNQELKADMAKISKDDAENNAKTLQKAQKLEDEVAKQQEKLYSTIKEKTDDPYKTINEGTKPLFAGNEIDPTEKKEAEERLKETELEQEQNLKTETKTEAPPTHRTRHHHRKHHRHHHHHRYAEEPKDEDDDEEDDDEGRDDIREDSDEDMRDEPREESYENYEDEDDDDENDRGDDDDDDDDNDDDDEKKSRVHHSRYRARTPVRVKTNDGQKKSKVQQYQGYTSQLPYGATAAGLTLFNGAVAAVNNRQGIPAAALQLTGDPPSFQSMERFGNLRGRNYINPMQPGFPSNPNFQRSSFPVLSTSLYKKDVPFKPDPVDNPSPSPKENDDPSDLSGTQDNSSIREELEDTKRSRVPGKGNVRYRGRSHL